MPNNIYEYSKFHYSQKMEKKESKKCHKSFMCHLKYQRKKGILKYVKFSSIVMDCTHKRNPIVVFKLIASLLICEENLTLRMFITFDNANWLFTCTKNNCGGSS